MAAIGKYLQGYHKKSFKSFEKNLDKVKENFDKDDIHELRITLKKIKALYDLFEELYPQKFRRKHHYRAFKNIFHYAGIMREAQLNKDAIKQYKISSPALHAYMDSLDEKERRAEEELEKAILNFKGAKLEKLHSDLKKLCKDLHEREFDNIGIYYIEKEGKKILKLAEKEMENVTVHKIRKHLKTLNAFVKLLNKRNETGDVTELIKNIKSAEALIGEWHDKIVLQYSLQNFSKNNTSLSAHALHSIEQAIKQLKKENSRLRTRIGMPVEKAIAHISSLKAL